ncbi:MAG: hypothetical protein IJX26_01180 [Clostridia bacterium]|nr:hypothetical protein [Clostridia bacterium]
MIEIDKTDFLYKYLTNLGAENVDELYLEYASEGVSNVGDFKNYIYGKYADNITKDIEEKSLEEVVDYYKDIKSLKKLTPTQLNKKLAEYKETHSKEVFNEIIHSKLKDILFIACLYKGSYETADLNDLIQYCNIGLINAIEKYNKASRIPFDVFVEFWINQEIEKNYTKEKNNA